jgi:hypothetical protein
MKATKIETEIKTIEITVKYIFFKKFLTKDDVVNGTKLINKWKKLKGWVEATENPILIN